MVKVIKKGLETSVQDYPGRIGTLNQGFPSSGPMDSWSFRLANVLVENDPGTAALECALEKLPTLLIDREGAPSSKFYELPKGKVIFKDWPEALDAVMEYFQSEKGIPGFGDWTSIIDELDPFRDGKAAYRMGNYLNQLISGFEKGLDRKAILENAAEIYAKEWGSDKIVIA